ncbi:MAG: hypothetical protein ABIQ35_04950, partial [Verrucomicrobiota bacterium]
MSQIYRLVFYLTLLPIACQAQVPEWIWHPNGGAAPADNEVRYFRKVFTVAEKPAKATLTATADDEIAVWINGEKVIDGKGWNDAKVANVAKNLERGENSIAIRGKNEGGDAAAIAKLDITLSDGKHQLVVTDTLWQSTTAEEPNWSSRTFAPGAKWVAAVSRGKIGVAPWGDVLKASQATAVEDLTLLPGFKAELLSSAQAGEGSWICMTIDDKGRLIISPQQDELPLFRVTLSADGKIAKTEKIPAPLHQAMGLLYAHDSLYVNGHGPS